MRAISLAGALVSVVAFGFSAAPAVASSELARIFSYTGMTYKVDEAGSGLIGQVLPFTAQFGYAIDGSMKYASLDFAGERRWISKCPVSAESDLPCAPVYATLTSAESLHFFTIEDIAQASVSAPAGFGGNDPLSGPGFIYDLQPGDSSSALLGYYIDLGANEFGDPEWGYVLAMGTVTRFEVALPEPATWAMLILGFGAVGMRLRRKRVLPG